MAKNLVADQSWSMLLVLKKIDAQVAAVTVNPHIEIVRSTQPWLTSMSQESSDAMLAVLSKNFTEVGVSIVNDLADLQALIAKQPDLVFLGMKFIPVNAALGRRSPKIWVADYLEQHGIPHTGSASEAHQLEADKDLAKQRLLNAGLNTSAFHVARQGAQLTAEDIQLTFPLFVKPVDRGGGLGIDSTSVVHSFTELEAKVNAIATVFKSDSLIEEYLPGREFSVAILKDHASAAFSVMPIELIAPADIDGVRLLSGTVKSSNSEQAIPVADKVLKASVNTLAMEAFQALGARDYGRIDIRLDTHGTPHFLEANLLPSLISGYGSFPKACVMYIDLEYEAMILSIVKLCTDRLLLLDDDVSDTDLLPNISLLGATA